MITGKVYMKKQNNDFQILDAAFIKDDVESGYCHVLLLECPSAPDDSGNLDAIGSGRAIHGEMFYIAKSYTARVRKATSVDSDRAIFYIED
jgi:hypothetical protein